MGRRDPDPRPSIEVVGVEPDLASTQHVAVGPRGPRGRKGRTLLGAGALAGVVLLGLTLGGGDEPPATGEEREERDNRERAEIKTTTTTRRPTTTTGPTTTTSAGPVFGAGVKGTILVYGNGDWRKIDLVTGAQTDLVLNTDDPYRALPVDGGVVVISDAPGGGYAALYYDLRSDSSEPSPVVLGPASQAMPAGRDDRIWLVDGSFEERGETSSTARLVDLAGNVLRTFEVPGAYAAASIEAGLITARGGRVYLVTERGPRPVAVGEVLGATRDAVVVHGCDDRAACSLRLHPTDGGPAVVLEGRDIDDDLGLGFRAVAADDGRIAVLGYPGGMATSSATFFDVTGRRLGTAELPSIVGEPRWLPGDLGLVSPSGDGVLWTRRDGDGWTSSELDAFDGVAAEVVLILR